MRFPGVRPFGCCRCPDRPRFFIPPLVVCVVGAEDGLATAERRAEIFWCSR